MSEIQYKTISIYARFGAHLRDYQYSIADGKHTVRTDSKIGSGLKLRSKVKVIDPPTYSQDKKWIQVINEDGVTGFIRASYVNAERLKAKPSQRLDKPLNFFHTKSDRIVYEASKGIRSHKPEEVKAAAADVSMRKHVYTKIDTLLDRYFKLKNEKKQEQKQEDDKKITLDMLYDGSKITSTPLDKNNINHANDFKTYVQKQKFKHKGKTITIDNRFMEAYFQYRKAKEDCKNFVEDMKESQIPVEYDEKSGCLKGDFTYRDLGQYGFQEMQIDYSHNLKERYGSETELVSYDRGTFVHGNRAYAEKSATERMKCKDELEKKEAHAQFYIPKELTNTATVEQLNQDIADFAHNPSNLFVHQKEKHNGFLLAEDHSGTGTRTWLKNNMQAMKNAGIHTLYSEHLFDGLDQKLVDQYLATGTMNRALKRCLSKRNMSGFEDILVTARECGMRVVGIGSRFAQTDTNASDENKYTRALVFNQRAASTIREDQKKLGEDQKGFVVLAGAAHLCLHEGVVRGKEQKQQPPVHGLSQLLKMQVLSIDHDNGIRVESEKMTLLKYKDNNVFVNMREYCEEHGIKETQPERMNFQQLKENGYSRNSTRTNDFLARPRQTAKSQSAERQSEGHSNLAKTTAKEKSEAVKNL